MKLVQFVVDWNKRMLGFGSRILVFSSQHETFAQVHRCLIDSSHHGLPKGYKLSAGLPMQRHGHNVKMQSQSHSPITVLRISHSCIASLNKQRGFVRAADMPGRSAIRGGARI